MYVYTHYTSTWTLWEAKADTECTSGDGVTPLFVASEAGHLGIIRLLLEANVDRDAGLLWAFLNLQSTPKYWTR